MPVAWVVEGVEVPGSVARMLAYVAAGGAEGVVEPGGLKVQPLATPGTSVRVMPGAAMITNRYPGGSQQSYALQETTQASVPIAATGSGGSRTDLVVARIRDAQYAGVEKSATFEVIQGVPSNTTADYVKTLAYPALALARVTLPASTATVLASHITDLRALVRPRVLIPAPVVGAPGSGNLVSTSKVALWAGWQQYADIPSWCTRLDIIVTLSSYQAFGDTAGGLDVRVGSLQSADADYDSELPAGVNDRRSSMVLGGWAVPEAMRGTRVPIMVYGYRVAGKSGYLNFAKAQVCYDLRYSEQTV